MTSVRSLAFAATSAAAAQFASAAPSAPEPLPATMKAVVAHQYGGPEVLKIEEVPVPNGAKISEFWDGAGEKRRRFWSRRHPKPRLS